jgi:hypothetical protein
MNATESIIAHLGMLPDGVRIVRGSTDGVVHLIRSPRNGYVYAVSITAFGQSDIPAVCREALALLPSES